MDNGYHFWCKNLVLLVAILFAVVMVVQHFELPYGSELLPSLLSPKVSYNKESHFPVGGESSSDFVLERNQSLEGDLGLVSTNRTPFQKVIEDREDDRNSVSNGTLEKAIDNEHEVSANGFFEGGSSSHSSNQNRSSDSGLAVPPAIPSSYTNSDSELAAPVMSAKDKMDSRAKDATYSSSRNVKPSPVEGNFTGSANDSSLPDFHPVNNATMLVMPIYKMNEFLHKSYLSPHSQVCTRMFSCFLLVSEYGN